MNIIDIVEVIAAIYFIAAIALLSRVSLWSFQTQARLEQTNYLLQEMLRMQGWKPPQGRT